MIIWLLSLVFTLITAYLYLVKMKKYQFLPFLLLFAGMIGFCCLSITFFADSLIA